MSQIAAELFMYIECLSVSQEESKENPKDHPTPTLHVSTYGTAIIWLVQSTTMCSQRFCLCLLIVVAKLLLFQRTSRGGGASTLDND